MKDCPDHARVPQQLATADVGAPGTVAEAGCPRGVGDRAIGLLGIQTGNFERPRGQAEIEHRLLRAGAVALFFGRMPHRL